MNSSATPRSFTFLSLFLIAIVCLLCYSNTFHVPFQFDDPYNISEKRYVRDIGEFFDSKRIEHDSSFIMRPVTYFTFAVNYMLNGTDVVGYHIGNLAIHMMNGFLVYFLVLLTFSTPYIRKAGIWDQGSGTDDGKSLTLNPQSPVPAFISLMTALLFTSHPVQTQAVTYIVQRLASLATLFFLLSLVLYTKWRLTTTGAEFPTKDSVFGWRSVLWYLSSLVSAVIAMKTKEISFTLPPVITLHEVLFFEGSLKKRLLFLAPFLMTMVIIPAGLMGISKPAGEVIGDVSDVASVGSGISRLEYLYTQFRVIVTYIRLLLFPVKQNLDYDYPIYHSFFDPSVILSFLFLLSIIGTPMYLLCRSRIDTPGNRRGIAAATQLRLVAFSIFWFFITLSVESSVIPIADVIFEHRLYLPSVGFFIGGTAVLFMAWRRFKESWNLSAKILAAACGLMIVVLSAATYARNNVWRSEVSLWEDVAAKSPMKARSYNGLGLAYQKEGRIDEALESFTRAVAIDPSYAVAYNSLGSAYFGKNLFGQAVGEFSKAIALEPDNAIFRNNRGLAYAALGETDKAIADYREAISLDSAYDDPYHNLGVVLHGKGQYKRAIEEYAKAIALEPDNAIYYSNRGLSFAALLEFEKAIADYTRATALTPYFAEAYMGRAIAYGELGLLDKSHEDFHQAILQDPSKAHFYVNRAVVHERMQDIAAALSDFQKACELGDERGCGGVEYLLKKYQTGK